MKVLNLRCAHDHRFEGWFQSDADLQSQRDGGTLSCPLCGDADITRLPSAPRLQRSRRREPAPEEAASSAGSERARLQHVQHVQAEWLRRAREVLAQTEDVGDQFAAEARRIHEGEAQARAIRGQATAEQAQALADDGIQVMALPSVLKETLQ